MAHKKKAPPVSESLKAATREELADMYENMLTAVTFFAVAVAQHPETEVALNKQILQAIVTSKTPKGKQDSLIAAILCRSALGAVKEKLAAKRAAAAQS